MRVLIVHGSKLGGTEGIANSVANVLVESGLEVTTRPASDFASPAGFDAVIVGGALYANRWHKPAKKYIRRYSDLLSELPVWLFSSGPLDDTALDDLPPTDQVQGFMDLVSAAGHVTFGGRLESDAKGFLAGAMAKDMAGDWRDRDQIEQWAQTVASALVRSGAA